jgi:UDP:flavonoid glycosyltransferase YjiC (YdhE family)
LDVPVVSIHLQPSIIISADSMPVMAAGLEWLSRAPRWVRRMLLRVIHWKVDRAFGPGLRELRRDGGMDGEVPRGIMRDWIHAPDGAVCLFPEWYAPRAADWPAQAVTTRFPLYDEADVMAPDPVSEAFLAAGEAPVIVTPGSANALAGDFLREAALAVQRLGKRGMLLTRYPKQAPADLPETIKVFEYLPFGRVFPRAAAVIHHGGVGTTAQCLAAGVPQLIMPMAHDQPDNASRVKRLGVGDYIYPGKFKAARVAEVLGGLVRSPAVKESCRAWQERMREQMTAEGMGVLLEELATRGLRARAGGAVQRELEVPRVGA